MGDELHWDDTALMSATLEPNFPACSKMLRGACNYSSGKTAGRVPAINSLSCCQGPRHKYRPVLIGQAGWIIAVNPLFLSLTEGRPDFFMIEQADKPQAAARDFNELLQHRTSLEESCNKGWEGRLKYGLGLRS